MSTATLAAVRPAVFARGRSASSLAAEQPLSAPTFPRWKGTARDLSTTSLAALVALLAVLAALIAPGLASGLAGSPAGHVSGVGAASAEAHPALQGPAGETRVRASSIAGQGRVGVNSAESAGLHPGSDVFYDRQASGWLVAPRAAGLVDEAATVGRSASTEWGRVVQNFQQHGDDWTRFSAHVEQATGRAYRGGTSIEEIFRRGDDWLVRHRIYGPGGDVLHETFRPYAKFGR